MRRFAVGLVALVGLSGCYSKITAYDGQFTVAYATGLVDMENFAKPIAPGAKLDLVVFENGTEDKLTILEATSSKPGVVSVVTAKGGTITVKGETPGVAELTIKVRSGLRTLTDRMFFHVAKPAVHALQHMCTEEKSAIYVRGTSVSIFHGLATADKRPVIGYDYVPLTIAPADGLEFVGQPQAGTVYRYRAAKAVEKLTVKSKIDDSELAVKIVEPGDITAARLRAPERLLVGGMNYVMAQVELGSTPVCSQNALTRAKSLTPEICEVSAKLEDSLDDSNREQLAEVTGLKYGVCRLEMTLPELASGKGITLQHSIKIGKLDFPGESGNIQSVGGTCNFDIWRTRLLWAFLAVAQLVGVSALIRAYRRRLT